MNTTPSIGIPYAFHAKDAKGKLIANVRECPVCGERIVEKERKDFESMSGIEYAQHYKQKHAQAAETAPAKLPKPKLKDSCLYRGDNSRITCGVHAGASARYSGRTISGHRVTKITAEYNALWVAEMGSPVCCEDCSLPFSA